jgi:serine/threonine protein kinase
MSRNKEIEEAINQIQRAKRAVDVFGKLTGSPKKQERGVKKIFRQLAQILHPDHCPAAKRKEANDAFIRLKELCQSALQQIAAGAYGRAEDVVDFRLTSKAGKFHLIKKLAAGSVATLYQGTEEAGIPVVAKIANDSLDNDLLINERRILKALWDDKSKTGKEFQKYLPPLKAVLAVSDAAGQRREANIFALLADYYPLTEVKRQYPRGVPARAMLWMFKRLLAVLGYVHQAGVVHGAAIPSHLMINPDNHGLILVDWSCAVDWQKKERLKAVSADYEHFYPSEVFAKELISPATDIYLAAKTMIYIVGGEPATNEIPLTVPREVRLFLKSCLFKEKELRPTDAWDLYQDLLELMRKIYGPPRFQSFYLTKPD